MFHKNIPNNNKDIIRFLAKNFAGTKKVRNSILFCSVVIGIVAITMVFGISFGKIQAEEKAQSRNFAMKDQCKSISSREHGTDLIAGI